MSNHHISGATKFCFLRRGIINFLNQTSSEKQEASQDPHLVLFCSPRLVLQSEIHKNSIYNIHMYKYRMYTHALRHIQSGKIKGRNLDLVFFFFFKSCVRRPNCCFSILHIDLFCPLLLTVHLTLFKVADVGMKNNLTGPFSPKHTGNYKEQVVRQRHAPRGVGQLRLQTASQCEGSFC